MLTHDLVEVSYERLCLTRPFKGWKLPHVDDLKIVIAAKPGCYAVFEFDDTKPSWPTLVINPFYVTDLIILDCTLAHEMCHLREYQLSIKRAARADHGKLFNRLADQVCKSHPQFDRRKF